jgi:hypothetical protein
MHPVLHILHAVETDKHIKDAITDGFNFISQNPAHDYEYEILCTKAYGTERVTPLNEITTALFNAMAEGRALSEMEMGHSLGRVTTGVMMAYHLECGVHPRTNSADGKTIIRPYIKGMAG